MYGINYGLPATLQGKPGASSLNSPARRLRGYMFIYSLDLMEERAKSLAIRYLEQLLWR